MKIKHVTKVFLISGAILVAGYGTVQAACTYAGEYSGSFGGRCYVTEVYEGDTCPNGVRAFKSFSFVGSC